MAELESCIEFLEASHKQQRRAGQQQQPQQQQQESKQHPSVRDHVDVWRYLFGVRTPRTVTRGVEIHFKEEPPRPKGMFERGHNEEDEAILVEEFTKLEDSGIVSRVSKVEQRRVLCHPVHVIHQHLKDRPVVGLDRFNKSVVEPPRFKPEGVGKARHTISRNDYGCVVDIKSAYHALEVRERFRRFLGVSVGGVPYVFNRLPFGLSQAPRDFTKCLRPVVRLLRQVGVNIQFFLDDALITHADEATLYRHQRLVVRLLFLLGFVVQDSKVTVPSQQFTYLGVDFDTVRWTVKPALKSLSKCEEKVREILGRRSLSLRQAASLYGSMCFCLNYMRRLHYLKRPIWEWMGRLTKGRDRKHLYDVKRRRTPALTRALEKWAERVRHSLEVPIRQVKPDLVVMTDAGPEGFGGVVRDQLQEEPTSVQGLWSEEERETHQNVKEMMGIHCVLRESDVSDRNLRLLVDSRVCMHVMQRGFSRSDYLQVAARPVLKILSRCKSVAIQWVRSEENWRADELSRKFIDREDWRMDNDVFEQLKGACGFKLRIDLWATLRNRKLERFASRRLDAFAEGTAWEVQDWSDSYSFPPPGLLDRWVHEWEQRGRPRLLLVIPVWKAQWFYWKLHSMAKEFCPLPKGAIYASSGAQPISPHWRWQVLRM